MGRPESGRKRAAGRKEPGNRRAERPRGTRIPAPRSHAGPSSTLAPRKQPRQARAQDTVAAILLAATDVFASHGYARTNTNRIAERAGVSVGSLYQYFPGKDAILAALLQRHFAAVESAVERALAGLLDPSTSFAGSMHALLEALLELHDADPQLTRVVSENAAQLPRAPAALRKREEARPHQVEQLLRRRSDVRAADPALMAHLLVHVTEALSQWLVHGLPKELDRRAALAEAVYLLDAYVQRR